MDNQLLKIALLALMLGIGVNGVQATEVGASNITIQGGSNSTVSWNVPTNGKFKVFVFVGNNGTATNAVYRVYPKGKAANSTDCISTDSNFPCDEITVNQALNKGKWVQLTINALEQLPDNNPANTAWVFNRNGNVSVSTGAISSTENLGISSVRFDYYIYYPPTGYSKIGIDGELLPDTAKFGKKGGWFCSRDNETGLIWEVKTADGSNQDSYSTYSWFNPNIQPKGYENMGRCYVGSCDTYNYVTDINSINVCGYNDWRLPNSFELSNFLKKPDETFFPHASTGLYWSSSVSKNNTAIAVDYGTGKTYSANMKTSYAVQLVRGP